MVAEVANHETLPNPLPFRSALANWFKLGFVSFGGPTGQTSMMHQELVGRRRWISEQRFLHELNYTILPSFLLILPGAPFVETTRYTIGFTAHLTAVTAAVVGVILNLAAFLSYQVLWPGGFAAQFEWWAAVIGVAAFIALFKFKVGVVPVIAASALQGLGQLA